MHVILGTCPEGDNFWGVQVCQQGGQEYVADRDRDHGLWIFKYTPLIGS